MQRTTAFALAAASMALIGGAVTAATFLEGAPLAAAQAARYAAAAVLLLLFARGRTAWAVRRPTRRELLWLVAAATVGLSLFNLAIVSAVQRAEPALVASVVAAVPVALAVVVPLVERRRVGGRVLVAAACVAIGTAVIEGPRSVDVVGVVLAIVALAGEVGFTLLALPVLPRLGAVSVAFHTSWIAAAQMGVLALLVNRDDWFFAGDGSAVAAVAYLAAASAISFSFWFAAVGRIGGDLAGLTSGAIPIVATISGAWLGVADVNARQLLGIAIVTAAVVVAIRAPGIAHRPPEPETSGAARDA